MYQFLQDPNPAVSISHQAWQEGLDEALPEWNLGKRGMMHAGGLH
jgi:hypothetical protein